MISRIILLTLITLSTQSTTSSKTYTPMDLIDYTLRVIGYSKNFFVLDPDKYLMNSFNFMEAQRILESLYRYRGMKTFIYICSNINNLSPTFPSSIAFELSRRLDYNTNPRYYFVFVLAAEQRKYFYYVGDSIRNYLPPSTVDRIVNSQSRYLSNREFSNAIMGILKSL